MDISKAIQEAINGNALLFTGSGFSKGSTNLEGNDFKSGRELAEYFAFKCDLDETLDLDTVSDLFLDKFGSDALIADLKSKYSVKTVSSSHFKIAEINWKRIYTTNYDNVLEASFAHLGKKLTPVTLADDIHNINIQTNVCVHLNGYIDRLDRGSLKNEFKLTAGSYLTTSLVSSPWSTLFRDDIDSANVIFFIGYSLYDLDIKRLIYATSNLKDKCFFVTAPNPTKALTQSLKKFGQIFPEGLDGFVSKLIEISLKYSPVTPEEITYSCFEAVSEPSVPRREFKDDDIFRMLIYGDVSDYFVLRSIRSHEFLYYVKRGAINEIIQSIDNGFLNILIHSDLGNGKTLLIYGLMHQLIKRGFRVFFLRKIGQAFLYELDHIMKIPSPVAIIIDDYSRYFKPIEQITVRRLPNTALILTCRSFVNDVRFDRLCDVLGSDNFPEFCINNMTEEEALETVKLFDCYGLWGSRASLSEHAKIDYILDECRGEFQLILLDLLNSQWIQQRFLSVIDDVKVDKEMFRVLLLSLCLEVIGITPRINLIMDLLQVDFLNSSKFRRNPAIGEIVDISSGEFRVKSSILSKFILTHLEDSSLTIDTLIEAATSSDARARFDYTNRDIFRSLMDHSVIQNMLPKKNKRANTVKYYESIKNLRGAAHNPFFWLQYAIARLSFKDYEKAGFYFDTAYSYARQRPHFNTFQIDNHNARFLLEKSIDDNNLDNCMNNFRRAHGILVHQIRDKRKHYPYRVAANYNPFYFHFRNRLTDRDKEFVLTCTRDILNSIVQLPSQRQRHIHVSNCKKQLQEILDDNV